jgi:molybdopterin/thiamine biosynthesis adenylyltransferase
MEIMILGNMLEELKKRQQAVLYGLHEKEKVIVSSLKEKLGLKRIGIYQKSKRSLLSKSNNETFMFYLKDDQLLCIHNPSDKKPYDILLAQPIPYRTDFQKRNHGIIDESILQEKRITIVGLGSGGSQNVLDLAKAGVTNFILIDYDTVNVSNLCRSIFDLPQVGQKKTEATLEKLLRVNPCVNVQLYNEDVLAMDNEKLMEIIDCSDLIIEATDSVKSKLLINGMAYHSKPVIYPSVYDMGKGGDILFTIPGLPCFECVFNSIVDEMKGLKKGDWDYSTGQAKPMPALISDIKVVVSRTVKLALGILTADSDNSFIEKITEPGCTILFIGNQKDTFIFKRPFQEVWAQTEIDPECTCQTLR